MAAGEIFVEDENGNRKPVDIYGFRLHPDGRVTDGDGTTLFNRQGDYVGPEINTDKLTMPGEVIRQAGDGWHRYPIADYPNPGEAIRTALGDADATVGTQILVPFFSGDVTNTITIPPTDSGPEKYRPFVLKGPGSASVNPSKSSPFGPTLKSQLNTGRIMETPSRMTGVRVENIVLEPNGQEDRGFYFDTSENGFFKGLMLIGNCTVGFHMEGEGFVLQDSRCTNAGTVGVRVQASDSRIGSMESDRTSTAFENSGRGNRFVRCEGESSTKHGHWDKDGAVMTTIISGEYGGNKYGIRLQGGSSKPEPGGVVKNSTTDSSTEYGVWIRGGEYYRLLNNELREDNATAMLRLNSNTKRIVLIGTTYDGTATKRDFSADATDVYEDDPDINGATNFSPSSATPTLSFDTDFSHRPALLVEILDSTSDEIGWKATAFNDTDADGNYESVDVEFRGTHQVKTGNVTVTTSGTGVIDTGLSAGEHFNLELAFQDANEDTKFTKRHFWDDSAGTQKVELVDQASTADYSVDYVVIQLNDTITPAAVNWKAIPRNVGVV